MLGRKNHVRKLALDVEKEPVGGHAERTDQKSPRGSSRPHERTNGLSAVPLDQNQSAQGGQQNLYEKLFDAENDMGKPSRFRTRSENWQRAQGNTTGGFCQSFWVNIWLILDKFYTRP
jgi:hypothetical protein